jgi:hypothetical protein
VCVCTCVCVCACVCVCVCVTSVSLRWSLRPSCRTHARCLQSRLAENKFVHDALISACMRGACSLDSPKTSLCKMHSFPHACEQLANPNSQNICLCMMHSFLHAHDWPAKLSSVWQIHKHKATKGTAQLPGGLARTLLYMMYTVYGTPIW